MEMLKGYGKLDFRVDVRLPITLPIKRILKVFSSTAPSPYRACLFNAMCTTAFFAFLGIGEVTTTPQLSSVMQLSQISKLVDDAGLTIGLKITFYHFKHSYNQRPISISLTRRADICPVQVLLDYLSQRGYNDGALFHTLDGLPVSRSIFRTHLALLPMLPNMVFLMLRYVSWVGGSQMHLENTSEYLTSLPNRTLCGMDFGSDIAITRLGGANFVIPRKL